MATGEPAERHGRPVGDCMVAAHDRRRSVQVLPQRACENIQRAGSAEL
jgi:hypothetical protein